MAFSIAAKKQVASLAGHDCLGCEVVPHCLHTFALGTGCLGMGRLTTG